METETSTTPLAEWQAKEMFDEWLDNIEPMVTVFGIKLSPSTVLREADPIAYRTTFHDWVDRCQRDGWFTVEGH